MNQLPFIIDGHLDLSMNAMEWNRDLRMPVAQISQLEKGKTDLPDREMEPFLFQLCEMETLAFALPHSSLATQNRLTHLVAGIRQNKPGGWCRHS